MEQIGKIWDILKEVSDPEIPVLTICDLGIVRNVRYDGEKIIIDITPTYSGCPAMDMISMDIRMKMLENGFKNFELNTIISPAWTTDWMTEDGKRKLAEYGIAAPNRIKDNDEGPKECPQCHSKNTTLLSQFGSTACKSLYQCLDCKEPFDYFKCH
ncbi:MAG: 1,2-phenylacetyl-CoA epoxidase subunit PaaD [Ferruginibacter sp.]